MSKDEKDRLFGILSHLRYIKVLKMVIAEGRSVIRSGRRVNDLPKTSRLKQDPIARCCLPGSLRVAGMLSGSVKFSVSLKVSDLVPTT